MVYETIFLQCPDMFQRALALSLSYCVDTAFSLSKPSGVWSTCIQSSSGPDANSPIRQSTGHLSCELTQSLSAEAERGNFQTVGSKSRLYPGYHPTPDIMPEILLCPLPPWHAAKMRKVSARTRVREPRVDANYLPIGFLISKPISVSPRRVPSCVHRQLSLINPTTGRMRAVSMWPELLHHSIIDLHGTALRFTSIPTG